MQNSIPDSREVTVLLVDHSPLIIEALRRLLERIAQVRVLDAVMKVDHAIVRDYEIHPQVIVYGMSVLVPISLTTLPKLRQKLPGAFIVATGFDPNDEGRDAALGAGADHYVSGFKLETDLLPLILSRASNPS